MSIETAIPASANWFTGEAKTLQFTVLDSGGTPVNITGWSFSWSLRSSKDAPVASLIKTTGAGITIVNGPGGVLRVVVAASDTASLTQKNYWHILRRTDPGLEQVLASGPAVLQVVS